MNVVFAFDRDKTVSTGEGPVPIGVVRGLVALGFSVYAIGNQLLKKEAGGIPGHAELFGEEPDSKRGLKSLAAAQKDLVVNISAVHPKQAHRPVILALIARRHPEATAMIVVDDVDLNGVEGWRYYDPERFAKLWR